MKRSPRGRRAVAAIAGGLDRILEPLGWRTIPKKAVGTLERQLEEATKFGYYWHKAGKRIDIREMEGFGPLSAKAVAEHRTGMRQDRLYTLWQAIAGLSSDAPIVEVGAFQGGSARFLGEALQWHTRSNAFFVCDAFAGHASVDEALDGGHRVGEQFVNTSLTSVQAYLADLPNITLVEGDFMATSGRLEPQAPFAFVHLDVDVYPVMRHALAFFAPRMQAGSLIVVDDYGFITCQGARRAVDEFAGAHAEFRFVHLLTGQALLVRLS